MFKIYEDEDITILLEWSDILDSYFIHTNVNKWSLSKYKKYLIIFSTIVKKLKEEGNKKLYAIPPSEKEEKWQSVFGFKDSGVKIGNYKVMEIELWV